MSLSAVVFCALLGLSWSVEVEFPPWFKLGVSTSAYQIEGGWNASDKAESIWDRFIHEKPSVISDHTNGDVACDSYHLWGRDVEMAAELKLNFYRFSIAWTRLLPTGYSNKISRAGAKYYGDLIDGLIAKGIEPLVTLYHWDLPQNFQELGGWTNPLIADWFVSYARVAFSLYGNRVKTWITINEPIVVCDVAYTTGALAPGYVDPVFAPYLCNKNVMLAHAKAWRIYDENFKPLYHGKVSISNNLIWYKPSTRKDHALTNLALDFTVGRYSHPIYSKEGGWPASVIRIMEEARSHAGYEVSRLPEFTEEEIKLIRGAYDFYALNYYTCRLVRHAMPDEEVSTVYVMGIPEIRAVMETPPYYSYGVSKDVVTCPTGLRELMGWLKRQYGDMEFFITENGFSNAGSDLNDTERIRYIGDHLEQVLLSIKRDEVNVTGYTYWALMDNFEWMSGFEYRFGLYEVDFASEKLTRTPRASARYYSEITRSRAIQVDSRAQYFDTL